ncbi:MAG: hypothetical protein MJB14_08340 [Spirochaetes bacterium]|nr:hypothetical protein [Spirochaetota bacterium]
MKYNKIIILLFLIFSVLFHALAEDEFDALFDENITSDSGQNETSSSDHSAGSGDFELSLIGEHSASFHVPVIPRHFDFDSDIKAPKFNNDLGIEIKYKKMKLVSMWNLGLFINDWGNWEAAWKNNEFKAGFLRVKPLDNAIYWSPWKFNLGVGFQYYTWGLADKLNPTDNINPKDYRQGLDADKISVFSASATLYPVDFMSIEAVYVPFEQSSTFPLDFAEKIPEDLYTQVNITGFTGGGDPIYDNISRDKKVEEEKLAFDLTSFKAGGKVNFFFPTVDFSFSYLYDIDTYYTPEIKLDRYDLSSNAAILGILSAANKPTSSYRVESIDLTRNRIHRFGFDIKATVDRFGIWLETAYSMTEDYFMNQYELRNHNLAWTLGFDFNYGPDDDFYFNIQYVGEFIPDYDQDFYGDYEEGSPDSAKIDEKDYMKEYYYRALVYQLGTVTQGLTQGLSINMEWPVLDSKLTPSITAAYFLPLLYGYEHGQEVRYGSLALQPELDIMPFDSFHIVIGSNLYFSWIKQKDKAVEINRETDRIGQFNGDSNIYVEVRYKWNYDLKK